jgi:NAD+ kinase
MNGDHPISPARPEGPAKTPQAQKGAHATPTTAQPTAPTQNPQNHASDNSTAVKSPCFVHSHLDKGASLTQWLQAKNKTHAGDVGVAKNLMPHEHHHHSPTDSSTTAYSNYILDSPSDDEAEGGGSLTKQLAETAVGVREMSKQLGACLDHSVHCNSS